MKCPRCNEKGKKELLTYGYGEDIIEWGRTKPPKERLMWVCPECKIELGKVKTK